MWGQWVVESVVWSLLGETDPFQVFLLLSQPLEKTCVPDIGPVNSV